MEVEFGVEASYETALRNETAFEKRDRFATRGEKRDWN